MSNKHIFTFKDGMFFMEKVQKICLMIFKIACYNFLLFVIIAILLGGDAENGYVSDGHYYLKSHGKITETSPFIWHYSWIHANSISITHPIAFIAIIIYSLVGKTK